MREYTLQNSRLVVPETNLETVLTVIQKAIQEEWPDVKGRICVFDERTRLGGCDDLEVKIRPCPFCGNEAKTFPPDADRNIISCKLGHAPMRSIEAWNTRS